MLGVGSTGEAFTAVVRAARQFASVDESASSSTLTVSGETIAADAFDHPGIAQSDSPCATGWAAVLCPL